MPVGGAPELVAANTDQGGFSDGALSELMELKEFAVAGSKGAWSNIAPDGSLLMLRDLGGADLYAIDWSER